ncbi:hypothetical protein OAG1_23140 [Agarivorans sp. OAG1]|uniref:hypothetical protein n=1 Tax=Agarivorans sp. OAG1 TaxID=3082387 RepID=UPI002B2C7E13|nr:hypothetical protein OAG1_23140 [Agarivorans sp. OAG1]
MKKLKIETFENNARKDTIQVPIVLAKLVLKSFVNNLSATNAATLKAAVSESALEGVILDCDAHIQNERVVFSIV